MFLYISIDENSDAWQKAIDQYQSDGIHAISKRAWDKSVSSVFGIASIPRYMLINKNGEIVDNNAKRPSTPGILDDLIKLLD